MDKYGWFIDSPAMWGRPEEPKKPRVTRKELKRELANLRETVEGLQRRIDASPENQVRGLQRRLGEIEHHITVMGQEAYNFRKIIKMLDKGSEFTPAQLFYSYFHVDLYSTDVELTPEETAKVFENIKR